METVKRMLLSQWSLLDICICACLLGTDDWSELDSCTKVPSIDGQHWQGIELRRDQSCQRMVLSQWSLADTCICAVICSVLTIYIDSIAAWTPRQVATLVRHWTRATALFIDLTFCKAGNCEENACLTEVTAWHLHLCLFFGSSMAKCVRPYADWHRRSLRCNSSTFRGQSQARKEDLNHIPKQTTWDVVMAANCGRHGSLQSKWFRWRCRHGQALAFWTFRCSDLKKSWKRLTAQLCKIVVH